ncbi:tail fiber protein [Flavobacterium phage vB_FspP_elemoC_14-1A]|jgi:hypothetical protein|uniref:Putative tail fiber protein n=2 Tax=Elemovirus TaxID=2948694 RepID=A0A7D7F1R7_9CAUD|nr:tail fiber protein [Flavobacterium phage vB_FspP_elemoB_14-3B]YP_010356496.1 tail fiber protein [Flavobacterium phage vB_FspP_elemoC_14-1A]QMP84858.1 putative tail fiber protein [Flavobacterium phage vB_FspP_elemoC_14-1A]QMP84951.1 putative tail fiber protein [Flavobacterium phage vB_FspP_elemoB_14-3B]QMP88442.1 putative tail fiber protein [Flavobacterium phage vB_FspP_elemoC_3-9B]
MATIPSGTKFLGVDPTFTDLTERKGTKVDRKSEYFTLEDITATVGVGSEGPQGVEGPAGPPGPVGPAGLEWQGAWDTDSSYAEDDAVGFNGASWFCISAVTGTGNSNPEEDTTHWALLAAQGAQGIQGIQGPTGPSGATPYKSYVAILGPGALSTDPPNVNSLVFNNTGGIISFTRIQTGVYAANITGATFTSGKTVCFATPMYFGANDNITKIGRVSSSQVRITTLTNNVYATDGVIDCQIEIRIYN